MNGNSDLLQSVLSQSRLHEKSCLSEKIYRDEPILMTASQMANYTPPIYKKMREIAHLNPLASDAFIFYHQAKMMEQHTDNYEQEVTFLRYYPTYQMMSDAQLRSYFTWRTKVRKKIIQKTNLSFVYIYMYELLNGIGFASSEDGFAKLLDFRNAYLPIDPHIGVYLNRWLKDYCIYYNLPQSCLKMIPDYCATEAFSVLFQCDTQSVSLVFSALMQLSDYNFASSRFFKLHPQDCQTVSADVARELNRYFRKSGLFSSREYFFGTFNDGKRSLFAGAVFYEKPHEPGYHYIISPTEEYEYRDHQWYFKKFMCFSGKAQRTGAILRTIDSKMRLAYGFRNALKKGVIPEEWEDIIDNCIENFLIKKRFESAPKIEIDLSCLQNIRTDALETQQRLLIVQQEDCVHSHELSAVCKMHETCDQTKNETKLSDLQFDFLCCLLSDLDYKDLIHRHNTTIGLVCSDINDVLFEEFCDTVIDFNGETPCVLPDYIDGLKGYLGI